LLFDLLLVLGESESRRLRLFPRVPDFDLRSPSPRDDDRRPLDLDLDERCRDEERALRFSSDVRRERDLDERERERLSLPDPRATAKARKVATKRIPAKVRKRLALMRSRRVAPWRLVTNWPSEFTTSFAPSHSVPKVVDPTDTSMMLPCMDPLAMQSPLQV